MITDYNCILINFKNYKIGENPMHAVLSLAFGYLVGCINPARMVGKKKNINLKKTGTGNLGATNTALVLGRKAGYFVLFFDMFKSIFSYKLARWIFPQLRLAGLIAGIGVLIGHAFPVFFRFQGGKSLASFGGLVLAHDPLQFVILLTLGIIMSLILNYGVYLAVTATTLFPVLSFLRSGDWKVFLATAVAGGIVLLLHTGNLRRAITGEDPIHTRDGLKKIFHKNNR